MGKESSVPQTYHDGHRRLQERFDTRRLADRIDERLVNDLIDADDKAFIESFDMFFWPRRTSWDVRTAPTRAESPALYGFWMTTR